MGPRLVETGFCSDCRCSSRWEQRRCPCLAMSSPRTAHNVFLQAQCHSTRGEQRPCGHVGPQACRSPASAGSSCRHSHLTHLLLSKCFESEDWGCHRLASLGRLGAACFHSDHRPPLQPSPMCLQLLSSYHNGPTQHQGFYWSSPETLWRHKPTVLPSDELPGEQ